MARIAFFFHAIDDPEMMKKSADSRRPIAIDLFSGAGGMSLGIEQAGFDVVCSVEYDPVHAAVHKRNFPECATLVRSAAEVDAQQIRAAAGIGDARVDLVVGGPPCQGFSSMGHKALDDPRNEMVVHFLRIAFELGTQYFALENVRGLVAPRNRPMLEQMRALAIAHGYEILPHRQLNAREFGVPQDRVRIVLIGRRLGAADVPELLRSGTGTTCAMALDDLPDADDFAELLDRDWVETSLGPPSPYAAELRCMEDEHWHCGRRRAYDATLLSSSLRTVHAPAVRQAFAGFPLGKLDWRTRLFRLAPDGVCSTLRAGTDAARGSFTSPRPVHHVHARAITVREMARLHGFPDWFRFHATKAHGARQVGNSVPPPLARALGRAVMVALGRVPAADQRRPLPMDDRLIEMTMTGASSMFGVPVPFKRRSAGKQKSGGSMDNDLASARSAGSMAE